MYSTCIIRDIIKDEVTNMFKDSCHTCSTEVIANHTSTISDYSI